MDSRLQHLLSSLRRAVRVHLALAGLARVGTIATAAAFGSLLLDWWLQLEIAQRGLIGTVVLGVIVGAVWRYLWRPLSRSLSATELALTLERSFPKFGDRLLTAVEIGGLRSAKAGQREDVSTALLEQVTVEAAELAAGIRPAEALDRQHLLQALGIGAAAALLIALGTAFFPQELAVWWQRDVLLHNVEWPHSTQLQVTGFTHDTLRVVRGAPFNLLITASGRRIPDSVRLVLDYEHAGRFREALPRSGENKFAKRFEAVVESFRFRAYGGDGSTGELRVEVVDPPMLRNVRLRLIFPDYTKQPPREIGPSDGTVEAVIGTRLELQAVSTRPLQTASLAAANATFKLQAGKLSDENATGGLSIANSTNLTAHFVVRDSGLVRVTIEDLEGLKADPALSFALDSQPDRPPTVRLMLSGIGDKITPVATLPMTVDARDDFGVAALSLATSTNSSWQSQPLAGAKLGNPESHLETRLSVEPFHLTEGSVFNLRVDATDAATPPGSGQSQSLALRVVSAAELLQELNRRQKEYRAEFERLTNKHRDAMDQMKAIREQAAGGLAVDLGRIASLVADEREVGNGCQAMSELFKRILEEMQNNQLGSVTQHDRLRARIIEPLGTVGQQLLGPVVSQLSAVTPAVSKPLEPAYDESKTAYNQMRLILAEMVRGETLTDAIATLREILKEQGQLNDSTRKALEEELKRLLK